MALPLVYTVCDRVYFDEHAEAFRKSAERQGHQVRIDLVSAEDNPGLTLDEPRCLFSVLRYIRLPELLAEHERVLVMDIDSVFNAPIEFNDGYDMALYFRPWIPSEHLKVLLSAAYFTRKALPFAEKVRDLLVSGRVHWCDEQIAVWRAFVEDRFRYRIFQMNENMLNFDFVRESPIWTAKGSRKNDARYVERRRQLA